jgi:hypothetical protein
LMFFSASLGKVKESAKKLLNEIRKTSLRGPVSPPRVSLYEWSLESLVIWIIVLTRLSCHLPEVLGSVQKGSVLTECS